MTPEMWQKVGRAFDEALDLAEIERETFLQQLRQVEPDICTELERLLKGQADDSPEGLDDLGTEIWSHLLPSKSDGPIELISTEGGPKQIDQFLVECEIGRGGMGVVYKARQIDLQRPVAIKMILAAEFARAEHARRFQTEAEALARFQHPNIIQIHQVGQYRDYPYLCLEYVDGGNLSAKISGQPQPIREAAALVETLAAAIHAAHEKGIVHRDLKPANVLLSVVRGQLPVANRTVGEPRTTDDEPRTIPKLTDFGLAKILDEDEKRTATGAVMGTPNYMAPEQAEGTNKNGQIGPSADVYSLGAILYEMLTGRPPFLGQTPVDTLQQVIHYDPPPVSRLRPDVPRDLETICHKCLEKEPGKRYTTAAALENDLRRFLDGKPVTARPIGRIGRTIRWARRNPAVAALLALVAVVFMAGFAGVVWQWRIAVAEGFRAGMAEVKAKGERDAAEKGLEIMADVYRLLGRRTTVQLAQNVQSSPLAFLQRNWLNAKELAKYVKVLTEAKTRLAPLAHDYPKVVSLQSNLVDVQSGLAAFLLKSKKIPASLAEIAAAHRRLDSLAKRVQTLRGDPHRLGDRYMYIGAFYMNERTLWKKGADAFDQSARFHRRALEMDPDSIDARKACSVASYHLAEMQRRTGQIDAAAQTALQRRDLWRLVPVKEYKHSPDEVYDAACELAKCIPLAGKGKAKLTQEEAHARDRYAKLAVETLRIAVKMGLTDPLEMHRNADFVPLHGRADYKELLSEIRGAML